MIKIDERQTNKLPGKTSLFISFKYNPLIIEIIKQCDVLIDGRYVEEKRDITLKWRGSSNQRVINVQKSLQKNEIVLHCD